MEGTKDCPFFTPTSWTFDAPNDFYSLLQSFLSWCVSHKCPQSGTLAFITKIPPLVVRGNIPSLPLSVKTLPSPPVRFQTSVACRQPPRRYLRLQTSASLGPIIAEHFFWGELLMRNGRRTQVERKYFSPLTGIFSYWRKIHPFEFDHYQSRMYSPFFPLFISLLLSRFSLLRTEARAATVIPSALSTPSPLPGYPPILLNCFPQDGIWMPGP